MILQKILKGIGVISPTDAQSDEAVRRMLIGEGIICNWWLRVNPLKEIEVPQKLTERNLLWHLEHYDDNDLLTGAPFRENTPYISTTAGCVERDAYRGINLILSPFLTALQFATEWFSRRGYVFYAYVLTVVKQSIPLRELVEEVRELHVYTSFLRYHPEGDIRFEHAAHFDILTRELTRRGRLQTTPVAGNCVDEALRQPHLKSLPGVVIRHAYASSGFSKAHRPLPRLRAQGETDAQRGAPFQECCAYHGKIESKLAK